MKKILKNEIQKTQNQLSKTNFAISKRDEIKKSIRTDLKIRDIESVEPIKQALRYIFALVGLRTEQIPGDIEKIVLINFIKDNLKNHSPEEIKLSFEVAVKGDFKTELNHYGHFSALYLSRVFNDYLDHRRQIVAEMQREDAAKELKDREEYNKRPEVIEKHNKNFDHGLLTDFFNQYKENGSIDFELFPVSIVFKTLKERHGFFKDLSKEEIQKITTAAEKRTDSEINHRLHKFGSKDDNEFRKVMKEQESATMKRKDFLRRNQRKIAIENLFERIIQEKKELKDFFK